MNNKILMKGNEAIAEAALRAGCRHFFGYPITPQTDVAAYFAKKLPKMGGTFLQAESEIAAINMVLGAASTGVRAMTSSSSPGISLKTEGISYIIGSDVPCLIVNVQRGGPGLGGIQPSQSDYWQATKAPGHGDGHLLVYAPESVQEIVSYIFTAFDKAEQYRMPAMLLLDGILGQMMEPVSFDDLPTPEPKDKAWALTGTKNARTHNIVNSLYLKPEELEKTNFERFERYETVKKNEQKWEEYMLDDAEIVLVATGIAARVTKAAINQARADGIKAGMIRPITVFPFPTVPFAKAAENENIKSIITVELNMGQMIDDVRLAVQCKKPVSLFCHAGGIVPSPKEVYARIAEAAKNANGGK